MISAPHGRPRLGNAGLGASSQDIARQGALSTMTRQQRTDRGMVTPSRTRHGSSRHGMTRQVPAGQVATRRVDARRERWVGDTDDSRGFRAWFGRTRLDLARLGRT